MFLHLPERVFFETEMKRKALQQNAYNFGWTWYYTIESQDHTLQVHYTGNAITSTNYIMLQPTRFDNRFVNLNIKILNEPIYDPTDTHVVYSYTHKLELIFEQQCTHVYTYYPHPSHFWYKRFNWSADHKDELWVDNDKFKLKIFPMLDKYPGTDVQHNEWSGFLGIGMVAGGAPAVIQIPMENFILDEDGNPMGEWDFAVVRGHWLGGETMLSYGSRDDIKPVSMTIPKREFEVVVKPGESLWYSSLSGGSRGFAITYIQFYRYNQIPG